MRIRFFASDKPREQELARAFCDGIRLHKDRAEIQPLVASPDVTGADAVCMVGVKSKRLFNACAAAGVVPIMLDKGYVRTRRADSRVWEYWRVATGGHHPTAGLMSEKMPGDRFEALGLDVAPWRHRGLQIVIAGSSQKYHDFYDLPDPTAWAKAIVSELRELTDRPIIYRPKPSWKEAVPIRGTTFGNSNESIRDALANSWALVTHGSNACFEAALMGIPSIVLGDAVAAPISSRSLADIGEPLMAKREQWLHNLAYRQWTESEMRSGEAWGYLRKWITK